MKYKIVDKEKIERIFVQFEQKDFDVVFDSLEKMGYYVPKRIPLRRLGKTKIEICFEKQIN